MRIKWYGLSCFLITGEAVSIITDPYRPDVYGLVAPSEHADIVVCSSREDPGHSWHWAVNGEHDVLFAQDVARTASTTVRGIRFEAFETRERPTDLRTDTPESNAMFLFTVDGLRILHTGDIGMPFTADQLEQLRGQVDVLLAVTGDRLTIALEDLNGAISEIAPRVVIPCHFQVRRLTPRGFWLYPVEAFLSHYPVDSWKYVEDAEVSVRPETLPDNMTILILEAAG